MRIESDALSSAGRAAHDAGLAAMLGGNLFGRLAMHPALESVSDASERGRVVNRAWTRYGIVNSTSLAALLAGWAGARTNEAHPRWLSPRERVLARAKDVAMAAVVVTGAAAAVEGMRFSRMQPEGAVPLADGSHPGPYTPPEAARLKAAAEPAQHRGDRLRARAPGDQRIARPGELQAPAPATAAAAPLLSGRPGAAQPSAA